MTNKAIPSAVEKLLWVLADAKQEWVKSLCYVLPDGVRESCPCIGANRRGILQGYIECPSCRLGHNKQCKRCRGLGYVPSSSVEVWIEAIFALGVTIYITGVNNIEVQLIYGEKLETKNGTGDSILEALVSALEKVLQSQFVPLGSKI